MRSLFPALLLSLVAALCLTSCGTYDLTAKHVGPPPRCEVHGATMYPETMPTSPQVMAYLPGLSSAIAKDFPHHGTVRLEGEEGNFVVNRRVRAFVCPVCQKNYLQYRARLRRLCE